MPGNDGGSERGVAAWLRRWWRALLSELLATALMVWLGLLANTPTTPGGSQPLAHVAMAFGFVVLANVMAFGPVSGAHMNPAVTLGALVHGKISAALALAYALAQLAGATLGVGLLMVTTPQGIISSAVVCTAPNVSTLSAVAVEAALTGTLVLACCGAWSEKLPDPAVAIKFGLVVAGLVYVGGQATGASLNPARSFGPALLMSHWTFHWVYWVGPLGGAALAAALHRWVLTAPPARPAPLTDPADLPLRDKP